jgi:hypothetical protein
MSPSYAHHKENFMAQTSRTRVSEVLEKSATPVSVNVQDIAQRAYALYIARGSEDGHDIEDWLEAERQLLEEIASADGPQ